MTTDTETLEAMDGAGRGLRSDFLARIAAPEWRPLSFVRRDADGLFEGLLMARPQAKRHSFVCDVCGGVGYSKRSGVKRHVSCRNEGEQRVQKEYERRQSRSRAAAVDPV